MILHVMVNHASWHTDFGLVFAMLWPGGMG